MTWETLVCNTAKEVYVSYYVENPTTNKLVRKKVRLNHVPKKELKAYSEKLISEINTKLYKDWNPFTVHINKDVYLVSDVIDYYLKLKKTELRATSYRFYSMNCDYLFGVLPKQSCQVLGRLCFFNCGLAVLFLSLSPVFRT